MMPAFSRRSWHSMQKDAANVREREAIEDATSLVLLRKETLTIEAPKNKDDPNAKP